MEHQLSNAEFFAIFASIFGLLLIFLAIAYVVTAIPTYLLVRKWDTKIHGSHSYQY